MPHASDRRRANTAADAQPLRLLVVDDDPDYRTYVAAVTRRLGFAVTTAVDGEEALRCLEREIYDAVIVDHDMPRLTGIDTIVHIRASEATSSLYAVMLTARQDLETKLRALEAGFDDFLAKGMTDAEIVAKLTATSRLAARQRSMRGAIQELYGLATRDELTGVFNRRVAASEAERLLAAGVAVNVVLFDLDDFKQVNDKYGHLFGDRVLRDVAALFHQHTRPGDIVVRFGGDEFILLLPNLELDDVEKVAARLSEAVAHLHWRAGDLTFAIGTSTGIASSRLLANPDFTQLVSAADRDLYKNKWVRKHPDERPELYEYPPHRGEVAANPRAAALRASRPYDDESVPSPEERGAG